MIKKTNNFGVEVPTTVAEAYALDCQNNNTLWHDAIWKEMENVKIIRGLAEVRSLRQLLQKGDVSVLNDGRLVISCIGVSL